MTTRGDDDGDDGDGGGGGGGGACGARVVARDADAKDDGDDGGDDALTARSVAGAGERSLTHWSASSVEDCWERLSAHEFGAGAHDEDAKLVAFLEVATTAAAARGRVVRALEKNKGAMTSMCPILITAFVSTAHTDRIGHVIAGLTFGRGFLATKDAWLLADEPARDVVEWLANVDTVDFDHAPISLPARAYQCSTYFTQQLFYLLKNAQYERGVWFERLFTSLKHYAHDLSVALVRLKEDNSCEDGRRKCILSGRFLYTHLRLLETTILYMPEALLDVGKKHARVTAELIEFIQHNKLCENALIFDEKSGACLNPEFKEALGVALFGVCVANRDVQRVLCQKIQKTPDFSRLLDVDFAADPVQTCSSACTQLIVKKIKHKIEEEIKSMHSVPKDRDLSADAPEEFLDSITGFIMTNPVRLQSSLMFVDASTIARLKEMGSKNDPFTGCLIEFDACEVDSAMKQRLDAWYSTTKT